MWKLPNFCGPQAGHSADPRSAFHAKLRVESLESRRVLDGDSVALADDAFQVHQNDEPLTLDVLANDIFSDDLADTSRITSVSYGSEGGTVELADQGRAVLYRPPADFAGTESFVYYVNDTDYAQVRVDVLAPLQPDTYEIPPDGQFRHLDVLQNDPFWSDYSGARRITSVSVASAGGTVEIDVDGRSLRYLPPAEAYGQDQFVYIVDGRYPARVTISIPETLRNDRVELLQNSQHVPLDVLANDPFWPSYSGAREITHVIVQREGAQATITSDGHTILYSPAPDAYGWDTLRYVVDGVYEARVDVRVQRPVRDDRFALDQGSADHAFNVLANDNYVDLQQITRDVVDRITAVGSPESGGTASISLDSQSIIYTPPANFTGTDMLTYVANNNYPATVYVDVSRPVRDDAFYQAAYQDTPLAILDVLANDFLGNGFAGDRVITSVDNVSPGAIVQITPGGRSITYTAPTHFTGTDTFRYTVDGDLDASVSVYVRPLVTSDYWTLCVSPTSIPRTLDVLANDHFQIGYSGPSRLTSASVTYGSGSVSIADNGQQVVFTPGTSAQTQFNYVVDGLYDGTASVSMLGHLAADTTVVDQNSSQNTIDVLANDFAYTNRTSCNSNQYTGPRRITAVEPSEQGGSVSIAPDGQSVNYQPPSDYVGDDRFTYVVDGVMETSVTVHVIRHVRDDQYHLSANADPTELRVLVNDLFAADYRGPRRITQLSANAAQGSVTIGPDGQALIYTPQPAFVGTDTFKYIVDDALIAQVEVEVSEDSATLFPRFETLEGFEQFLIDDALVRYSPLFGQPGYVYPPCPVCDSAGPGADFGNSTRDHSETNVQVDGIDEGDIVEFDDSYTYVVTANDVVIVDAWPADSLSIVSRLSVEGNPLVEFLHGDRLTVISETPGGYYFEDVPFWDFYSGGLGFDILPEQWELRPFTTYVTVFDVTVREDPRLVQTTSMQGRYVESRGFGDYVYVAVMQNNAVAPPPRIIPDATENPNSGFGFVGTYESQSEYLERFRANTGDFIDQALPNFVSYGPDETIVRSGLLNTPEEVFRPIVEDASHLLSVVSFDIRGNEPGFASTSGVYTSGAGVVYASLDHFYVFDTEFSAEDGSTSRIMKFAWSGETGDVSFVATGVVPGTMINQFSADELNGYLRVATTISNANSGNWSGRTENTLYVLAEEGGLFVPEGRLENLALGETIRSVRFLGERAVVSTFRNIDPLFTLDLQLPSEPRVVGHITLPGYLSYIQMIDNSHLLAVGHNTPNGGIGPTQVVMFNVSDFAHPQLVGGYTFERFSTSEATLDHHAFGYFAAHGLLAIPSSRTYVERVDEDQDGYRETRRWVEEQSLAVFEVDPNDPLGMIQFAGEIEHDEAVRRSGYIGDKLYSIGADAVRAVDVSAPGVVIGSVLLAGSTESTQDDESIVAAESLPATLDDDDHWQATIEESRTALASELHVMLGEILFVAAELRGERLDTVLRLGDRFYLYSADALGTPQLLNDDYDFTPRQDVAAWHNEYQSADVTGDGVVDTADITAVYQLLASHNNSELRATSVARQIDGVSLTDMFPDVDHDRRVTIEDAFAIVPQLLTVEPGEMKSVDLPNSDAWSSAVAPRTLDERYWANDLFVDDSVNDGLISLSLYRAVPGDANGDARVDGVDLDIWMSHRFQDGKDWIDGDFDLNGVVDGSDFGLWNSHKFRVVSTASEPVPARVPRAPLGLANGSQPSRSFGDVAATLRRRWTNRVVVGENTGQAEKWDNPPALLRVRDVVFTRW